MGYVGLNRLAGKTQRVKLRIDQTVRGVPLKKGDTCDLELSEATRLQNMKRADFVEATPEDGGKPVAATR